MRQIFVCCKNRKNASVAGATEQGIQWHGMKLERKPEAGSCRT